MKFRLSLPRLNFSRKARSKALTISIAVGVVTFLLATFGGKLTMGKVTSVVVAAKDLQPGQVITAVDLRDDGKLSGTLPTDVITSKNDVIGLSLSYPVKAGQPLIKGLVANTPMRNGLYPGEVGVWVPVSLTTSGLVRPGDIISVYLTPDRNGGNWGQTIQSQMISSLEGVRVVTVINNTGQQIQPNPSNPNGNVPVAVQLAIPKENAGAFSQLATGKVSLVIDPFATPKTHMSSTKTPPSGVANPPMPPAASEQNQGTATPPPSTNTKLPTNTNPKQANTNSPATTQENTQPTTQTPPQVQQSNINPGSLSTNPKAYNPPIFNPNGN